ncbi:MAG: CHC2 zinc finger domain-containing protein [Planctomycetota bacterium]
MPTNAVTAIKERANIVQIAQWAGLTIAYDGQGDDVMCLCPFHKEDKPSFSVSVSKGLYKCFGCSATGDSIALYMKLKDLDFSGAVRELSERLNISVASKKPHPKKAVVSLNDRADSYHLALINNEYLLNEFREKRRVTLDYVRAKKIGYVHYNSAFSIPIYDINNNIVNIRYHKSGTKDKWGSKGCPAKVLYDLTSFDRSADTVWVCEGEGDLWTCETLGLNAITSVGGVGTMPDLIQSNFKLFKDKKIYIVLDNDEAGWNATAQLRLVFGENQDVSRVDWKTYPRNFDVSDFVIRQGKGADDLLALMVPYPIREAAEFLTVLHQKKESLKNKFNPVDEKDGVYIKYVGESKDIFERISSFVIKGKSFIEVRDNPNNIPEGWLRADIINYDGHKKENILLPPATFTSKSNLMKVLNNPTFIFKGSDKDVTHIVERIMEDNFPRKEGVKTIGFHKDFFVCPNYCIGKEGIVDNPSIEYVSQGLLLDDMITVRNDDFDEMIPLFASNVLRVNNIELMIPALGWMISCYYKDVIKKAISYYPILTYFGIPESGKTSLAILLWKLFGVTSGGKLLSAHSTRFPIMSALASTTVVPIIVDELKRDIGKEKTNFWKQTIRSSYFGEIDQRGNPDRSIQKYPLLAPLMLIGEMSMLKEVAIKHRTIQLTFDGSYIKKHQDCMDAFFTMRHLALESFMPHFVMWYLDDVNNFGARWNEARAELDSCKLPDTSLRVSDNLAVIIFGIRALQRFIVSCGYELNIRQPDINNSLAGIVKSILTVKDRPKNSFDELVESIGIMYQERKILEGVHFKREYDKIYIHLNSCVPIFKKWAWEHQFDGEVLDRNEYFNQTKEMLGGYVINNNIVKRFRDTVHRTVEIDLHKAGEIGLDMSSFGDMEDTDQGE